MRAFRSAKLRGLVDLLPTIALILIVLGIIYAGLATPTESAAPGVVTAIVIAIIKRRFSFPMLHACAEATARNTAMIGLILLGAYVLNYIITLLESVSAALNRKRASATRR